MTITFQYTPELLQQAHEIHYKRYYPLRGRIIFYFGLLAFWAGILLLLIPGFDRKWAFGIPLILYGVVAVGLHFYMSRTIGKRAFKKLKECHEPFTVSATAGGLQISIQKQPYDIEWKKIGKALATSHMILLYPNDKVFFIFPKKNFEAGDFDSFRELVKEKVSKVDFV